MLHTLSAIIGAFLLVLWFISPYALFLMFIPLIGGMIAFVAANTTVVFLIGLFLLLYGFIRIPLYAFIATLVVGIMFLLAGWV